ncbi:BlaI/MecI/CopY family transcriptional regulator [Paeniglutamicibacter psychrophenolicus]|uniref:Transcriptional regulator n=1 Tax=Paeniglutamicibacter psychrophenolicus TaxID=257454 RepID=A0ABS4WGI4_9MICC|nr:MULTISPECIES: BlaI/MecI/CopY family transcriptional regulator [Micrococcaceae]MBP2375306.1 putative transcriptional regulator [Paeniglutamicibacter psychrophenolicus]RAX51025.1 transcriptional regulator [Arthrobacter sp. AQ5-05]
MATLGDLERAVMDLLWDAETPLTANELRDLLAAPGGVDSKELAVTTVLTVLARLEKKGLVARERDIRPHRYTSVTSREEHTVSLMNEALGTVLDREAVLARFIGGISAEEAQSLRLLLDTPRNA